MKRFEVFTRDYLVNERLTIAKDRVTVKFTPTTTEERKAEILRRVQTPAVMELEVPQTVRGEIREDYSVRLRDKSKRREFFWLEPDGTITVVAPQ